MILRPGHLELSVTDLEKSVDFYVNLLGFQETFRQDDKVYLRAAEEFDKYSLILKQSSVPSFNGFALRVSSTEYLDVLEQKHIEMGMKTKRVQNEHERVLRVIVPGGHPVEYFHYKEEIDVIDGSGVVKALPMRNTHAAKGIPPLMLHHINFHVPDINAAVKYWESLEFSTSEYAVEEDDSLFAAWIRRSGSTHDIAILNSNRSIVHHFAYMVDGIAGVVRTADLLADAGLNKYIEYGPGRHGGTNAFFLYIRDPDGHRIEIFSSDYRRDHDRKPLKWSKKKYVEQGRLWWGATIPDSFYKDITTVNVEGWVD